MPYSKLNRNPFHPQWGTHLGDEDAIDDGPFGFWIWEGLVKIDQWTNSWEVCWVVEGIRTGVYFPTGEAIVRGLDQKNSVNLFFATYKTIQVGGPLMLPDSYITGIAPLIVQLPDDLPQIPPGGAVVSLDTFLEEFNIPIRSIRRRNGRIDLTSQDKRNLPPWGMQLEVRHDVLHPKTCRIPPSAATSIP